MIRNTIHTFRSKCRALVCSLLTLAVFPQFVSGQAKSAMTDKPFDVTRWIETHFAKGKIPPFSFVYDGKPSRELLKSGNTRPPASNPTNRRRSNTCIRTWIVRPDFRLNAG